MDKPTECPACGAPSENRQLKTVVYFDCGYVMILKDGEWVGRDYDENDVCTNAFAAAVSLRAQLNQINMLNDLQ